jgi:gamma-glutamyl:cysteine ligase YbdK (ATP-grasp superfamily)
MGEEIQYSHFKRADFNSFEKRLAAETQLLTRLFDDSRLSSRPPVAGYELEAWLMDSDQFPRPDNEVLLKYADNALLSPELARFNFELNVEPRPLHSDVLSQFRSSLSQLWQQCAEQAAASGNDIIGIGILPTLTDADLTLENISTLDRYRALNEHVLRLRDGEPIELNIVGNEHLQSRHMDVMLEAAATSLQIHIQAPQDLAVRYYNASILLSAPMVAISANSPFLFGKQLWEETRIPVFEQSVPTGGFAGASHGPLQRVGFGTGYARESMAECFVENLEHYPIMLPVNYHQDVGQLRHLRLHNGTIWRWNRPLIGFDDDGTPHIRVEHRVCAAGPSIEDNIANIAFYYGLVHYYATLTEPAEDIISFTQSRTGFYAAAQHGIHAHIDWVDGERSTIQRLVLDRLLVECETGLHKLGIYQEDIDHYLSIIDKRIASGQTGSAWQRRFAETHDNDMNLLTKTYLDNQRSDEPVHDWDLSSGRSG